MIELAVWVLGAAGFTAGLKYALDEIKIRRACRLLAVARLVYADERYRSEPLMLSEAAVVGQLDRHPTGIAFTAGGFRSLGDRRVTVGGYSAVVRFFISPCENIVVYFSSDDPTSVNLESMTASSAFVTRRGRAGGFAKPPTQHYQWMQGSTGVQFVEQHEKWVANLRAMAADVEPLLSLRTLEQLDELFAEQQRRIARWRNGLNDDELLDMDLRALLHDKYDGFAHRFRRHMLRKQPVARVRPPRD